MLNYNFVQVKLQDIDLFLVQGTVYKTNYETVAVSKLDSFTGLTLYLK